MSKEIIGAIMSKEIQTIANKKLSASLEKEVKRIQVVQEVLNTLRSEIRAFLKEKEHGSWLRYIHTPSYTTMPGAAMPSKLFASTIFRS